MSKPRRKGDSGTRSHNSSVYREEDGSDEEGAISLNAIKNKYKSGAATAAKGIYIYFLLLMLDKYYLDARHCVRQVAVCRQSMSKFY
jgi:hypothetical protein